jgi:hypothetical protein
MRADPFHRFARVAPGQQGLVDRLLDYLALAIQGDRGIRARCLADVLASALKPSRKG